MSTHTQGTDDRIPALLDRFVAARGLESDRRWAEEALARFLMDDVREDVMVRELAEAAAVVEGSGTRPDKLFGPPADWARSRRDELAGEGQVVLETEPPLTWRSVPSNALIISALFSIPFALVFAVRDGLTVDFSWAHLLVPLVLGSLMAVVVTLWSRTIVRRTFRVSVAIVVGAVLVLATGAGFLLPTLADLHLFTGSVAWHLAIVAGYLALGVLGFLLLPTDETAKEFEQQIPDDGTWALVLGGTLRGRLGYSDERARQVVEEARAHAAASGSSLSEEFGTPQEYAARFQPDTRRRDRLYAVLLTLVAAYWMGMLGFKWLAPQESVEWWRIFGAVLFPVLAGWQWRLALRPRTEG